MSFVKQIKRFLTTSKKSDPYNSQAFGDFSLSSNEIRSTSDEIGTYKKLPWIAVAVDALMRDAGGQTWHIENAKGDIVYEPGESRSRRVSRSIIDPLEGGAGFNSLPDLMATIVGHMALTGNGLLWKAPTTALSVSRGISDSLIPICPGSFKVKLTMSETRIEAYELTLGKGKILTVPIEDVIHFSQNRIYSPFWGVGQVEKMRTMAEGEMNADQFNSEFMGNKASPSLFIKDEMEFDEKQLQRNMMLLNKKYQGSNNAGNILYLSGKGVDAKPLQISHKDLQWLEQKEYNKETVLSLFGVVPEAVGVTKNSNRSTIEQSMVRYYSNINSILENLEKAITSQHVSMFDKSLQFKFKKHFTGDVERLQIMVRNGFITPNEASKRLGLPFDDNDEARNTFYMAGANFELGSFGNFDESSEETGKSSLNRLKKNESKSDDTKDTPKVDLSNPKNFSEITELFLKSATKPKKFQGKFLSAGLKTRSQLEDKFAFKYDSFFKSQKVRVRKAFNDLLGAAKSYQYFDTVGTITLNFDKDVEINGEKYDKKTSLKGMTPSMIAGILLSVEEDESLKATSKPLHTSGVQRAIGDLNDITNSNVNPNTSNDFVRVSIASLGKKVTRINESTRRDIAKIITNGVSEDLTIAEISTNIQTRFVKYESWRSRMIARTESRQAYDQGAEVAYKEIGVNTVDIVGCTGLSVRVGGSEEVGSCGWQDIPVSQISSLDYHPNHVGVPAPSVEP